jgi:hypothetical protein
MPWLPSPSGFLGARLATLTTKCEIDADAHAAHRSGFFLVSFAGLSTHFAGVGFLEPMVSQDSLVYQYFQSLVAKLATEPIVIDPIPTTFSEDRDWRQSWFTVSAT